MGTNRRLWLYDSFEGLPETSEKDGERAKEFVGKCLGSVQDVRNVLKIIGADEEMVTIKKGWFDKTFNEELPDKVALLHLDADWYDSIMAILDTFYELIPAGGGIILDDFGYWEGCREAFYDFCFRHNEKPLIERVDIDQAYWIKGKTTNKSFSV